VDINSCLLFVQFCANKKQQGYITPDEFNMLAPIAQLSLINDRLGNEKKFDPRNQIPPYGFGVNQKIREELRKILVTPTTTAVSSGIAAVPADYLYYDTISVNGRPCTEVTQDEINEMNNSLIIPPSVLFPKFLVNQSGIYIYPASITSIKLSWVRMPATPIWNFTIVNDEPVYNPSGSQDFEVSPLVHLEVCMKILSNIGIHLNMAEIVQYSKMQEAEGQ
jgi:hypothetical protein